MLINVPVGYIDLTLNAYKRDGGTTFNAPEQNEETLDNK